MNNTKNKSSLTKAERFVGKTKIMLLSMVAVVCSTASLKAQVDLVPGINYSYNPPGSNGVVQIVNEDVCNNGAGAAGQFDVVSYIYNTGTSHAYVIGDTTFSGISGNACGTINNWNININNTPGIPAGTYKLGEWVNYQHMVTEVDTTNNAGLFSGSWTYTPTATGITEASTFTGQISVYPNPGNGIFNFRATGQQLKANSRVEIYNLLGEKVANNQWLSTNSQIQLDISDLAKGMYLYKVISEQGALITMGKLVNQ